MESRRNGPQLSSRHHDDDDDEIGGPTDRPTGFPRLLESHGFFLENSSTWNVLENHFGPGKSGKLKLEVLESRGKMSLKVVHFASGLNDHM